MSDDFNKQIDRVIDAMREGFERMDGRFDQMNGRVRTAETDLAVLKDRSQRADRKAGLISGIVAAVIAAIGQVMGGMQR